MEDYPEKKRHPVGLIYHVLRYDYVASGISSGHIIQHSWHITLVTNISLINVSYYFLIHFAVPIYNARII